MTLTQTQIERKHRPKAQLYLVEALIEDKIRRAKASLAEWESEGGAVRREIKLAERDIET